MVPRFGNAVEIKDYREQNHCGDPAAILICCSHPEKNKHAVVTLCHTFMLTPYFLFSLDLCVASGLLNWEILGLSFCGLS